LFENCRILTAAKKTSSLREIAS